MNLRQPEAEIIYQRWRNQNFTQVFYFDTNFITIFPIETDTLSFHIIFKSQNTMKYLVWYHLSCLLSVSWDFKKADIRL